MRIPVRREPTPAAAAYAATPHPALSAPWHSAPWCVVDLELSGLDPRRHEIVSFAALPIEGGRVQLALARSGLVRPSRPLSDSSVRVHGIRDADLRDAPPLKDALEPLLEAMAGRTLVCHVARIERAFLGRALREMGVRLRRPTADTSVVGRLWLAERDGFAPAEPSLEELASTLGLPSHSRHDALGDALTTAQVFIAAATHLDALAPMTVRGLTHAHRRLKAVLSYPKRGR
ncbi:MAG TPA: 3'-5' exonuclease [Solirubrobacteraceae bacterium]|nr:3'-5' exonuclease [Solirubrobacteraceae bacterium]